MRHDVESTASTADSGVETNVAGNSVKAMTPTPTEDALPRRIADFATMGEAPLPVPPPVPLGAAVPPGTRQRLQALGPVKFAEWIRDQKQLLITDTTLRDAHQSLLATRVRTYDMLVVADAIARLTPNLFSLEMWGGATFDTSMRFLQEDPWQRLTELRQRIPNILFQMLLRASNAVGYTTYPDNVVRAFIKRSAEAGIDVFRMHNRSISAIILDLQMPVMGGEEALPLPKAARVAIFRALVKRTFADVYAYFFGGSGEGMRERVRDALNGVHGPVVVVAHSLGTIIAYDVLRERSRDVPLLVTAGSPLAVQEIEDLVTHPLRVPDGVAAWRNVCDARDLVALDKTIRPEYTPADRIRDFLVVNDSANHHDITDYLRTAPLHDAVVAALT